MEKVKQERRKVSSDYSWRQWEYIYHPTGKLRLELTNSMKTRGQFTDGARGRPLDDQLGAALESIVATAQAQKEWELQAKREREAEHARRTALEEAAARWRQSQDLRACIDATKARADAQALTPDEEAKLAQWVTWARAHADRLDPLSGRLPFEEG